MRYILIAVMCMVGLRADAQLIFSSSQRRPVVAAGSVTHEWDDPSNHTFVVTMTYTNATAIRDASGNAFNMTNLPTWGTGFTRYVVSTNEDGVVNFGIDYDGVNDLGLIDINTNILCQTPTFAVWVNHDSLTTATADFQGYIDTTGTDNAGAQGALLVLTETDGKVYFYVDQNNSDWKFIKSDAALNTNQWYFLVASRDATGTMRMWIDNVQQAETNVASQITYGGSYGYVGFYNKGFNPGQGNFNGQMDIAVIDNYPWTAPYRTNFYLYSNPTNSLRTDTAP